MNTLNRITAEDLGEDLKIVCNGEFGFVIATVRGLLKTIAQMGPNEVTGFTAAISTIIETTFDKPDDRKRIATLLYREFGGDGNV